MTKILIKDNEMLISQTTARTNMKDFVEKNRSRESTKIFKHQAGWSAECSLGLLMDAGTDTFVELEPLLNALRDAGVERITVEL
ncbi:hypothetical protein [Comamonas sp. CMM01]|uniref:hypothetical protein n=1 Tax=Comamonas sp. CMM01 TaxID=2769280 RepID=UPI00177B8127|nr:hypothetical protein [Comamonas sp. CMM01]